MILLVFHNEVIGFLLITFKYFYFRFKIFAFN